MNETLDSKKNEIDFGVKFRRSIHRMFKAIFRICSSQKSSSRGRRRMNVLASEISSDDEEAHIRNHRRQDSEEPMLLSPVIGRTQPHHQYRQRSNSLSIPVRPHAKKPRFRDIFTGQVIMNMLVFSGLALHTFSFDQMFPLLCSTK